MASSLRRPRFGSAGHGGVASYVLHCRRVAQKQAGAAAVDVDEPDADGEAGCDGIGDGSTGGSIARASGMGMHKKSEAHNGGNDDQAMDQCINLLGDHLKTFRDMCLRADALVAESSEGRAAAAAAAASSATCSSSKSQPDEIPPQLLRVVRFFRHKWPPLKRALLRPPEPLPRAQQQEGGGKSSEAVHVIEVGSPALRLRLARALHARGMLSLAEVDELAAALERQQQEEELSSEKGGGVINESPTKRRKLDDDNVLAARLRLALSRLPSDAGPSMTKRGEGDAIGSNTNTSSIDKARKGMRYARSGLSEWEIRWNENTARNGDGSARTSTAVSSSACPSPHDVADWALTAFTGIVLANGIDHRPGRTGGVGSGVKLQSADDSNLEQALAAILLPPTHLADNKTGRECISPLARAARHKIESYLSPAMVEDITDVHILSLTRLFAQAPYEEVVKNILAKSIVDCSKRSGGVGLQQLSKLVASYIALVESDMVVTVEGLEATLKETIVVENGGEGRDHSSAAAGSEVSSNNKKERALCFLDALLQTAKFLRL